MSSQDQKRNLKPIVGNQNAYSASPSQLTLSSDLQNTGGLPNPYQHSYGYLPSPHDPSGFGFPMQQSYGRPQQIQTQHHQPPPQHLQHQQQHSPINPRKRRLSELGDPNLPGSSSSNATGFGNPSGLMTAGADLDQTLGAPQQHQHQHQQQQQQQQQVLPSPVVPKKGRTNTPWTPAEEQRLKTLRDAGSSWSEIAKTFPTRTEGSVKKHWYKDMHYAEFAEDESAALLQAIKDYENNKWKVIGQKVGKPAKACEQFAKEQGWKI
ncbi:hypothetical protein TI39_contig313g00010 [Zymoseptoria brevis]|uniref:Uncharacterized protein n=2 Tax=Zymoseptoria TaxID=1047167 RepID=A0A0F4GU32_9PEZI|nr:hypothetical protein TI39_contig313g00010 [Zymoseptoria brevis]